MNKAYAKLILGYP